MNGLIIRWQWDRPGQSEPRFWQIFGAIRQDLDRLFWYFDGQPWMGFPGDREEFDRFATEFTEPFDGRRGDLWRPSALGRYADGFDHEYIDLWAMEPTRDEPARLASEYATCPEQKSEEFIRQHARVWLNYLDSTCWEIYARKDSLLDRLRADLADRPWAVVSRSWIDRRGQGFGDAGLGEFWRAINGKR